MTNEEIMKVVKPEICSKLKSPASAQFPVELISISGDEEKGYYVKGFVDSQNSYGAMIRNDFTANVAVADGIPIVVSSSVGVQKAKNDAKAFGISYVAVTIITLIGAALLSLVISAMVGMM